MRKRSPVPDPGEPQPGAPGDAALPAALRRLRDRVQALAPLEGRNDSLYPGLRCYRFSAPLEYRKTQRLVPGVVVVVQGGKTAELGGRELAYDEMNCLVLGGEAVCRGTVVRAAAGRPYLAIHLDLPPALLVKAFIKVADARGAEVVAAPEADENFVSPVDADLLDAFARLLQATGSAVDRGTIAPLVVEEIIVRLVRSEAAAAIRSAAAITRSAARIQRSIQFIEAEHARPLTVGELARQAAMSPSHFAHTFRQVAGVSPMRHLRDVRLDAARALMAAGAARAGEAAARVGFESAAHFAREFKRREGVSPTEFARRMAGIAGPVSAGIGKDAAAPGIAAPRLRD